MKTYNSQEHFEKMIEKQTTLEQLIKEKYGTEIKGIRAKIDSQSLRVSLTIGFNNGYGIDIVWCDGCSYGHRQDTWELALIRCIFEVVDEDVFYTKRLHINYSTRLKAFEIVYDNDEFGDVIGYVKDEEIPKYIDYIINKK